MREEKLSRFSDYKKITSSDWNYLVYINLIRDIEIAVSTYASGRLIDIGCGNKPYLKAFENKITEYVGCDIVQSSRQMVDIICEAGNIPLGDDSFDTVFSTQTIEHVEYPGRLISEAYRLLKPCGYFILSGPMYWPLHEEPHDYYRFTKYGFEYLLKNAGFEIVKIMPNGGVWATAGLAITHAFAHGKNKNIFFRAWRFIFFKMRFYWLHNVIFNWLDKVDYNPQNTINYVIVGRKNPKP